MKTNILFVALAVAGLSAFMFWTRYLRFHGSFENGRYIDPETGRAFVERAGWMWGALLVLALVLAGAMSRR